MSGVLGALAAVVIVAVLLWRRRPRHDVRARGRAAEDALAAFIERAPGHASLSLVLADALATAKQALGVKQGVFFEPGLFESWDARPLESAGADDAEPLSEGARAVFAWFQHNPMPLLREEISPGTFGSLEPALRDVYQQHRLDLLLPLVDRGGRGQMIGVLGLGTGGVMPELELIEYFRVAVTAAAANVRLGIESSLRLSLERPTEVAGAVRQALVPSADEGRAPGLSWVGHFRAVGEAGHDFFSVRDRPDGRVLILMGDTLGDGLASSLASASVKSFCDALATAPSPPDASGLLQAANRAACRVDKPRQATCFAAVVDAEKKQVRFANAGHPMPYHLRRAEKTLGVLCAAGPFVGDRPDAIWQPGEATLAAGDALVFYSEGLVGAMNHERMRFGERRLQRALLDAIDREPRATRDAVLRALEEFRGEAAPMGDEAVVVVQVG